MASFGGDDGVEFLPADVVEAGLKFGRNFVFEVTPMWIAVRGQELLLAREGIL